MDDKYIPPYNMTVEGKIMEIPRLSPLPDEDGNIPRDAWSGFHDTDKVWRDK